MNASTYYSGLVGWLLGYVRDSEMFFVQSVVTCGALFWLLHRAWLTLWKPVPELISILGVEVPDSPEVSLGRIKADAVTLHWTRPGTNKPVLKYLIQVNGVNVGESSRLEIAITVTGLKPGHFYNVRVIAVGNNNFQAGSRVIRLRTYGRDGRPELGNGRVPANLSLEELQHGTLADSSDESAGLRSHGAVIETAAANDASPIMVRESGGAGQRRNTVGRRSSPSNAAENPPKLPFKKDTDESMQQLTERFEDIRGETEETILQISKDGEEFKAQILELSRERDEKRQILKEKEEASEKLKREVHNSERTNRQAQNRKTTKEKALRDKQAERLKMQDDLSRWQSEIGEMHKERETWKKEREEITQDTEKKVQELKAVLRQRQNSLNGMEEEIRVKGLQIKELEEERQKLPGGEYNEEARERDAIERQKDMLWDQKERDMLARYNSQSIIFRNVEDQLQRAHAYHATLAARQANNPPVYQSNTSGVDYDPTTGMARVKSRRNRHRSSRTSTISSPPPGYPAEPTYSNGNAFNALNSTVSPTFAPGPYFDMSAADTGMIHISDGMSEADIRMLTAGAPLSPTATSLLPSSLFADDESPFHQMGPPLGSSLFGNNGLSGYGNDGNSPESSSRSDSFISSPRTSANNIQHYPESDRQSQHSPGAEFGVIGSPSSSNAQPVHPTRRIADLFTFPRQRGKTMQEEGPALGSLKAGQSHSFPRQTDEGESTLGRTRRTSFSTGWSGLPFLNRAGTGDVAEGNAPAPARNALRKRRGFNMFSSSIDDPSAVYSERDPSSPRPASIASSDLPRPSTDSAPFGWPAAEGGAVNRNSPLATNWSLTHMNQPWSFSRNPSRRPSIQHGSSSALSFGIATDDDEFLPPDTLSQQSSPPPVGVIGTRPQSSMSATPRLNPAAPTFKAMFSRTKSEKASRRSKRESIDSYDERDHDHDEAGGSPADSRKSRDTRSIHTQASIAESYDSLDHTVSSTASDVPTPSGNPKETSFQKLLRKGSSSKFSIGSFRSKDSSLFGGKNKEKAGDRNASGDRSSSLGDNFEDPGEEYLGRSVESVTSSPMIGGPKENRISVNWSRFSIKKGKERERRTESSEGIAASETDGTEDEDRV